MSPATPHATDLLPGLARAQLCAGLTAPELIEHAVASGEGRLAVSGSFVVDTGRFTGRSPEDRFLVQDRETEDHVEWGEVNRPISTEAFERLRADMDAALAGREVFEQRLSAGADPRWRVPVTVYGTRAWHGLFARNLFIRAHPGHGDGWTVLDLPDFRADPERHGTRTGTVVALDLGRRLVLIAGTAYGGEIKKSIFSALNYALPGAGVLPMHGSANRGADGRTAVFFGLSGTGKTTLSADPERVLIGDDEHGWSEDGIFNFEGGCYAKVIRLDRENEPEIAAASTRFGTLLENVALRSDRTVDFDDGSKTENARSAYPLDFVPHAADDGMGAHPAAAVFLSADAFGVLPPISRLSPAQAMAHFLSGYTAKVAGTERGVTEPQATFSACFGAPFMPLPAARYAHMLGERLARHGTSVWLLNTGWTGGPPGVGRRIPLRETRAMVSAALRGALDGAPTDTDPAFGLAVPEAVPGASSALLRPRETWDDPRAYDAQARRLAAMFRDNFRGFEGDVDEAVVAALPGAGR